MRTMPHKKKPSAMTAEEFRTLLGSLGLKQGEAADRLGVDRRTVVRWLSGDTPISPANALLIRVTFGKRKPK